MKTEEILQWTVGIYDKNYNMIKPIKLVVGTFGRACKVCEVLQVKHNNPNIMFEEA